MTRMEVVNIRRGIAEVPAISLSYSNGRTRAAWFIVIAECLLKFLRRAGHSYGQGLFRKERPSEERNVGKRMRACIPFARYASRVFLKVQSDLRDYSL